MTGRLTLAARLDTPAAAPLLADVQAQLAANGEIALDAGGVTHLGGLCLQILLAAAADCRKQGRPFRIMPQSEAFDEAAALFGVAACALRAEAAE